MAATNVTMSDTYNALLSTTLRRYRDVLSDNINRELPLFYWLNEKGRKKYYDGGYQLAIPILYGENSTVKLYSGYEVLDTTPQEGITMAFYDWKNIAVSISISREEERKNSGTARLINLLETKIQQAEKSLQWYLNDLLHGRHGANAKTYCGGDATVRDSVGGALYDTDNKGFNSLDHLVRMLWGYADPTGTSACNNYVGRVQTAVQYSAGTGTYHDVDGLTVNTAGTVNPWWLNYSVPGFGRLQRGADGGVLGTQTSATVLDQAGYHSSGGTYQNMIAAMRYLFNLLSDGSDKPDLILCGSELFGDYEAALMPLERFTDTKLGDAGFQNLKFKTATMMFDHGIKTAVPTANPTAAAPAAPMYFLNSKYLEWAVDQESDFFTTPFYRPTDQAARTAQILLMAQLVTNKRSAHGVIGFCNVAAGAYTP